MDHSLDLDVNFIQAIVQVLAESHSQLLPLIIIIAPVIRVIATNGIGNEIVRSLQCW